MTMDLFTQFVLRSFLFIPILVAAMYIPWALYANQWRRWLHTRVTSLQNSFVAKTLKEVLYTDSIQQAMWLGTLVVMFTFLFTMNILGLLPYTFTPTTHLSVTMALATPLWFMTVTWRLRNNFLYTLSHFLPEGTPTLLIPFVIIIETISALIRPVTLAIRMMANLTAGHLLLLLASSITFSLISFFTPGILITSTLILLLLLLEVVVSMVQAFVFTLLVFLYILE